MAQTDQPGILSAEARTRQRDQAASELVRGLLLINGGGAAALLAFLQAIWSNEALAKPTIVALVILSVGASLAAAFHFFRHEASWYHQSGDLKRWAKFERLYRWSALVSLIAFLAGILVVAIGAWNALGT
jgi:hypothetical protein